MPVIFHDTGVIWALFLGRSFKVVFYLLRYSLLCERLLFDESTAVKRVCAGPVTRVKVIVAAMTVTVGRSTGDGRG
jgi:hypothetical protein